jgi:3-deoxy-D-arabino-heptulosonate 7-phosphate (DAHP) synthase
VHPDPAKSLSDGFQALTFHAFEDMMAECRRIAKVVGKEM